MICLNNSITNNSVHKLCASDSEEQEDQFKQEFQDSYNESDKEQCNIFVTQINYGSSSKQYKIQQLKLFIKDNHLKLHKHQLLNQAISDYPDLPFSMILKEIKNCK
ncbi:Hypothetical_protein [Hexamita inflata]|uniref:Hypothetical_protein n=1 Tax=Hexamita inflata TaxID=28002 RepID=A0ABP1H035_9EUKA